MCCDMSMLMSHTYTDYGGDEKQCKDCDVQDYDGTQQDQHGSFSSFLHIQSHGSMPDLTGSIGLVCSVANGWVLLFLMNNELPV